MGVNSGVIFDGTVSLGGGKVYTSPPIRNFSKGGFVIRTYSNVASGDVEAALSLESRDPKENDWMEEPLAIFDGDPDGSAKKTPDTFTDTQSEEYRIGIDPSAGSGPVKIVVSLQEPEGE